MLGSPDGQELYDQAEAYEVLINDATALPIGKIRNGKGKGWVLALSGHRWVKTTLEVEVFSGFLQSGRTKAGMSGSPILNDAGRAVALVSGNEAQPILTRNLPQWLLFG